MRLPFLGLSALVVLFAAGPAGAQRDAPYWASVAPGQAMMRSGPGRNFPGVWLYQRRGLPLRVVATYPAWRKVRDPEGAEGWMQANLLSETRTAMVQGDVRPMYEAASEASRIVWRAEPGVIGRITRCEDGWCLLDIGGRRGFVRSTALWGVEAGEEVED